MSPADQKITADIRKSIMADKTLSPDAQNVKVSTQNGTVTVKGTVHSEDELKTILAKAAEAAGGADKVVNELEVKSN